MVNTELVSVRIQIRIQGAKPIQIHVHPDPDQSLQSQKVEFFHEKYNVLT
jgi:hypothetical protein